jgi:ribonuclease BN (tRNA processing enzyme)
MAAVASPGQVTVTFAGSGDAFGSGGRFQACIHLRGPDGAAPVLLDCGATSLTALRRCGLDPGEIAAVFVSHLHADHFGGIPFFILNAQFARRAGPLSVIGPRGTGRRLAELMEAMFPGSTSVPQRFAVDVTELEPGETAAAAGVTACAFAADHPSGAQSRPLALRLTIGAAVIGYTGDTAWTDALPAVAAGTDLLIAEAYYRSKKIPYHLRLDDLAEHRDELASRRIVLTHMSDDVLDHLDETGFETASDGLVLRV